MKNLKSIRQLNLLWVAVLLSFASGCGSGSSSGGGGSQNAVGPISGNWQISLQKSQDQQPKELSGFLSEDTQGNVTGQMAFTQVPATPCSGIGAASGSINSAGSISLTVAPTGVSIDLTGTVNSNLSYMSGQYNIATTGCTGGEIPQSGSWTADLVQPFNGSILGTFDSTEVDGDTFPISGQVNQGQSNGSSSAPLTGNLSISGSSCFTSANISGQISGTGVVINLASSDGTQVGQILGSSSYDGTSLTGSYTILPQTTPGSQCTKGDFGAVCLGLNTKTAPTCGS